MAVPSFNVIFFFADRDPVKYRKVTNMRGLFHYMNKNFPRWKYVNLYNANTKAYAGREYNNQK